MNNNLKYSQANYKIIYNKYYETEPPYIDQSLSNYNVFNLITKIKGVTINPTTGVLYFNKDDILEVGNYNIIINLNINVTITITVLPDCIYESNIEFINYPDNFISSKPKINPNNGIFSINDSNFNIDNYGYITKNHIDVGNYNLKIEYTVNNITQKIDYQLKCIPIIKYTNNDIILDFLDNFKSEIPLVLPAGGYFQLKDAPYGISIENNGQIKTNNLFIGEYNFTIIYTINNISINHIFNILIRPKIIYTSNSIISYDKIMYGEEPTILAQGGIFEVLGEYEIDKNKGILNLTNCLPDNYSVDIKYTLNNISYSTKYNFTIQPTLSYNNKLVYKLNEDIYLEPNVYPIGGFFKHDDTGIFVATNLDIGKYSYQIIYTYNNINTSYDINFTIESDIYYENKDYIYLQNNIIKPINYNNVGSFYCNEQETLPNIDITNFEIGEYDYNITYEYNLIKTIINLKFRIVPVFYYDISNIELIFGDYANSNKPIVNYFNETNQYFSLLKDYDFIEIDKTTGIITFDNNLKLGNHEIEIIYTIESPNNISVNTKINIHVLPSVIYDNNIVIKYNEYLKINKPQQKLNFGDFSWDFNPSSFILNNDGSIESQELLDVGTYNLTVKYTIYKGKIPYLIEDSIIIKNISVQVLPEFYYENNNITQIYGNDFESVIPIFSHNGLFSLISNNNDNIKINTTNGQLTFYSKLDVDCYNLTILYKFNDITISSNYTYTLIPKINYCGLLTFDYSEFININNILVKPENGKFTSDKTDFYNIDENTGNITITDAKCGYNQNIKIFYEFNKQINFIEFKINIIPTIKYQEIDKVIYKSNKLSDLPIVKPGNGIFILDSNKSLINSTGQIIFDNFNVGKHNLTVKYQNSLIYTETNINFEIIPEFYYDKTEYEINFGDVAYSTKPIINPTHLLFEKSNDQEDGIINFSNYPVGIHYIKVKYHNVEQEIKLTVKPVFYYDISNIIINYNDTKIIYPIIKTPGGKFTSNNDNIIPDENTGMINLENINIMDEIITITYEIKNITSLQNIRIQCKQVFNYSSTKTTLTYGSKAQSVIPEIKPSDGKIICNNLPNNVYIEDTGIIHFNNNEIGSYILNLELNNIKINYYLDIIPIFNYEFNLENINEVFYYGFDNYSSKPIIQPDNLVKSQFEIIDIKLFGKSLDNHYITIDLEGIICIKPEIDIGLYEITITYLKSTTKYTFEIIPFILYENKKMIYGDIITVIPQTKIPMGGSFSVNHNKLTINNSGEITNLNLLNPDNYKIIINYSYNNKLFTTNFRLYIKPYINYINRLILLPDGGTLNYNHNIILINQNNEIILITNTIGKYNATIEYSYNNIKSTINIDILAYTNKLYEHEEYILYYNESIKIYSLIKKGFFETSQSTIIPENLIFNSDGSIFIDNMNVGIYYLNINCFSNNHIIKSSIKIIIKPTILYPTYNIIFGYTRLEPLTIYPLNGKFTFNNYYKNIKYTKNGIIIFNNAYPDDYKFVINYIYNNSIETINFTIKIVPSIYINQKSININYNDNCELDNILALPFGGSFKYNLKDIEITNTKIKIDKNKWIGTYDLNIKYTVNNQSNSANTQIIIKPIFYYKNNSIELTYFDNLYSEKPYFYPYGGTFILVNDNESITINSETGILSFSNVPMGNFNIKIIYKLNEFNIETNYTVISNPLFYYKNFLTINYESNYDVKSDEPVYYPKNGIFFSKDLNIDTNGVITFSNLDVKLYDFEIEYKINNKIIKSNYKFIVNPTIKYNNNNINIQYNNEYIIDKPYVNPSNGLFSCNNLPDGFILNNKTGNITIVILNKIYKINNIYKSNNKIADKGEYLITVNYHYNNQLASTNLFINII